MHLSLAGFLPRSEANGPGVRAVVWVQGCSMTPPCPGCINPALLRPGGDHVEVEALARRIRAIRELDGLTLSGGEPFDQADALAELAAALPELHLLVFSGRTLAELEADPRATALLRRIDVLVAGPYRADLPADTPLLGSANQVVHHLSQRSAPGPLAAAEVEWVLHPDGTATRTGVA